MALFMKQDFSPPLLSRRWIAIKMRSNMLIYSRDHIISILESGLLFREDCVEVEQEAPSEQAMWNAAGGGTWGWMTRGEQVGGAALTLACLVACPPKEDSLAAVIESTKTMLCRQQSALSVLMSRASSAILGNTPWLKDDVAWDFVQSEQSDNLLKIHHAFLVVQSTLLKHIAMAHMPPPQARHYKNHNERVHWIHTVLLNHLSDEFNENLNSLERMYRLLKNYGSRGTEPKKPGRAVTNQWLYSDVHNDIARVCLELKMAANKCDSIDVFLDACACNNQDIDSDILNRDIDELIDVLARCLSTAQCSQIRLKKLSGKVDDVKEVNKELEVEKAPLVQIENREPEVSDEVFYLVRTDADDVQSPPDDVTTGPGVKEREATKVVLNELKRKLVKREDMMREREKRALAKSIPNGPLPEFPRQLQIEELLEQRGFLAKLRYPKILSRRNLRIRLKHSKRRNILQIFRIKNQLKLKIGWYTNVKDILGYVLNTKRHPKCETVFITLIRTKEYNCITKWMKKVDHKLEANHPDKNHIEVVKPESFKVSKEELELSSSGSDCEFYLIERNEILKDLRRNRIRRREGIRVRKDVSEEDESLRPMEYSLGTGLAMASVLQINRDAMRLNMAEEEFIGDGQVSDDSGNDDE